MATSQTFRSAFNGFNREDVVRYIEYTNSKHEAQVNQLKEQLQALQTETDALREKAAKPPAINLVATAQVAELTEKCKQLEQENAKYRQQLDETAAPAEDPRVAQLQQQLHQALQERDEAIAQCKATVSRTEDELAAYRRAERTERMAQNRAVQMYDQANGTLADTAANLDAAAKQLDQVAAQTMEQIRALTEAVTDSKQVLSDAAATIGAIRPEEVEK